MSHLAENILSAARAMPEGGLLSPKEFLHLGSRAAIDKTLSRLAQEGKLLRVSRGAYVAPHQGRFGSRPPSTESVVHAIEVSCGETVVANGAAEANALGLTTQVPMRAVYLTSGPNRRLKLGAQVVEFRHAPIWQLIFPGQAAGEVVRALAWLGPKKAGEAIRKLRAKLPPSELKEIVSARSRLPTWMAQEISALVTHG